MSEISNARHILDQAERAASTGDLASAEELLRSVARIQEAELGPLHPDLANTLNNLGIVSERLGRPGDAESFYRRAVSIASASLPPDHTFVADSRKNLEDFCREHGLPIEEPTTAAADAPPGPVAPTVAQPPPPIAQRASRPLAWMAVGIIVLVVAGFMVRRASTPIDPVRPAPTPTPVPTAPQAAEPEPKPPVSVPVERAQPPAAESPRGGGGGLAEKLPQSGSASAAMSLAIVQLCRTLSTTSANWRCDPAGDSVADGRLVLYTRVRSTRDGTVVHRWYRGGTLRQSVNLSIRASATAGYRTYSRQAVDTGDWRIEVRSPDGTLLHEQTFVVK